MDNYWPLRGGKLRDVSTGQVASLDVFSSEQLGGLFWYLFSLYQEFAGEPEEIDAAQAMLLVIQADAAAPGVNPPSGELDSGVSYEQAVEAIRETIRAHEAKLEDDAKGYWKGGA